MLLDKGIGEKDVGVKGTGIDGDVDILALHIQALNSSVG